MQCSSAAITYNSITSALCPSHPAASHSQIVLLANDDPAITIPIPSPLSHPLSPHLRPITCSALQWNCNLTTRLPQLRNHLQDNAFNALAFQEPIMSAGSIRILGHIAYYSRPPRHGVTPQATLHVRRQFMQTEFVEYVEVTVERGK